jgi:hypothetical protein
MNEKHYLHKIELATRHTVIVIDNNEKPETTYTYLNDAPIMAGGKAASNKNYWTLGPVDTENEAEVLALAIAERYGYDVMTNGKLLGLPYMGKPGKWVTASEAAAALGRIKSDKKAHASRENGKMGGRPKVSNA